MSENQVLEKKENEQEKEVTTNAEIKESKKVKTKKKKTIIICVVIGIVFILLAILTIFSIINSKNQNIVKGIKIDNIDVSEMSIEEAKNKVSSYINEKVSKNIVFNYDEYEINVTPEQVGITFNVDEAVNEAYEIGRNGNLLTNNFEIFQTQMNGKSIELSINVNEEKLAKIIEEINGNLAGAVQEPTYYIEENKLIIVSGKEGVSVNIDEFKQLVCDRTKMQSNNEEKIQIPIEVAKPEEIDIDKIYTEIHKEAQDAYVSKDPFEIHPHVEGIDFAISIDEAKAILQEEKEQYEISLKITKPSVTTDQLGDEAFPNRLATYSTKFSTADTNRTTNIKISVNKINGVVLMPGEEFSYNKVLGPRTPQAGYKLGAAYIGGKVVSDYGGGVCQTSSTLYNTVLLSNLEVTSRTSHYFAATYVPIGRDATVYWPNLDFKFKNNRNYPIKIKAYVNNGVIQVDIFGTKEESDCEVELQSYVTSYVPIKTEYKDDPTLLEGKEVVEQAGSNGTISETYKILKKDGKVISKTLLSRDTYSGKSKIIRRGTKKAEEASKSEDTSKSVEQNTTQQDNDKKNTQENSQANDSQESTQKNDEQSSKKTENEEEAGTKTSET